MIEVGSLSKMGMTASCMPDGISMRPEAQQNITHIKQLVDLKHLDKQDASRLEFWGQAVMLGNAYMMT